MANDTPNHADIMRGLGRVEGRLLGIEAKIEENGAAAKEAVKKIENTNERVSALELGRAEMKGASRAAMLIVGAAGGAVAGALPHLLKKLF